MRAPTENVTITNCYVSGDFEEGTLLDGTFKHFRAGRATCGRTGRIKFGTESNGGFKNITISNCVFDGCRGLALETVDGALLEDITITNITMRDIVDAPIFLRLGARMRGPDGVPVGTAAARDHQQHRLLQCHRPMSSIISGIPGHEIEDLKLSNILIEHTRRRKQGRCGTGAGGKRKKLSRAGDVRPDAVSWIFYPPRAWPRDERH